MAAEDTQNSSVLAQAGDASPDPFYADFLGEYLNLGSENPIEIVVSLINIALSFLGLIFVLMVLYAGLMIMLSGGNEERLAKGKRVFWNALIGVAIIVLSWSIVQFILNALWFATGPNGNAL